MTERYFQDFPEVPDTEENLLTNVIFESSGEDSSVVVANQWPAAVLLNAGMSAVGIDGNAGISRIDEAKFVGKMPLYDGVRIDSSSSVKNEKSCCSKIIINFENTGEYFFDGEGKVFFGNTCGDYQLNFPAGCLFEKEFLVVTSSIVEVADRRGFLSHENTFTRCRVYPYGGLFEYGMHPQQMESCVFRTVHDGHALGIRISPLSVLKSKGINPCENQFGGSAEYQFVGVPNFSPSQTLSLYDELKGGNCQIEVVNNCTKETAIYRSHAVFHVAQTNLIKIGFIKE